MSTPLSVGWRNVLLMTERSRLPSQAQDGAISPVAPSPKASVTPLYFPVSTYQVSLPEFTALSQHRLLVQVAQPIHFHSISQ